MRRVVICIALLLLTTAACSARLAVSPVMIKANDVKAGDRFQIMLAQTGEEPTNIRLSLALFSRQQDGSILFLEDHASVGRAREVLRIPEESFLLNPNEQKLIEVEVAEEDFSDFSGVLFARADQTGIPIRFAVLFMLSSQMQAGEL